VVVQDGITRLVASFFVGEENGDGCRGRFESGRVEIIDEREKEISV
jgi:hypothetical protein